LIGETEVPGEFGELWSEEFGSTGGALDYVPAYSNDIVLLGGPATTTVKAVRVSTGDLLWEDTSVGPTTGRHPIITDGLALYHGHNALVAGNATSGMTYWRHDTTTAEAPVAAFGNRVYLLQGQGTLQALDLRDNGNLKWVSMDAGDNGSNLIATEKYVFVNHPANGTVKGLLTLDGSEAWPAMTLSTFGKPGIALAYDQLYAFYSNEIDEVKVAAYNPDTGEALWEVIDSSGIAGTPEFAVIANNRIYFYNTATGRIRVLDAFSGTLLWSIALSGVKGLSISNNWLLVLLDTEIQVYGSSNSLYFAQLADGLGLSSVIVLNNLSASAGSVDVEFYDSNGDPMELEIAGQTDPTSMLLNVQIPANGSISIQTLGSSLDLQTGWAKAVANVPITGTCIFQTADQGDILFEAGVADSAPTGTASLFVSRFETPTFHILSTGIAIANPFDETATVNVEFRRTLPTVTTVSSTITLGPGEHKAEFVEETFEAEAVLGSEGTFVITSDIPVVLSTIRTQDGFQMSSYPAAQPVR
jgi:outer membrane protein assembly factor BamB